MTELINIMTIAAALGSGLMGGIFFTFSNFVMPALARLAPERGVESMQWINKTVLNPWFLGSFFGTAALGAALALLGAWRWQQPGSVYLIAGAVLYIAGLLFVTMFGNVPLNEALAKVAPASDEAARLWARYLKRWVFWNHVRTVAGLAGAVAFILAAHAHGGAVA